MKVADADQQLILAKPEPGFSPARNKAIVEKVIRQNDEYRKVQAKKWDEKLEYRADAAASYLEHLDKGKFTKIEDYFGRELRDKIWGERFSAKLRLAQARYKKTGMPQKILL